MAASFADPARAARAPRPDVVFHRASAISRSDAMLKPAITRPTAATLVQHVDTSILLADARQSRLDRAAFQAKGFTSPKVRHLLNNLGHLDGLDYLEVGVHRGATFIATNYRNALSSAVAIDNWSEFDDDGEV